MKKRVFASIMMGLFIISAFALAQNESIGDDESSGVGDIEDKGYACLNNRIKEAPQLSLEESIFSMLALGGNDIIINKIETSQSVGESCWPAGGCDIKDTAQVAVAYERAGRATASIKSWLDAQSKNAENLNWYLQIDIPNRLEAECSIGSDMDDRVVTIGEDQSLSGAGGDCFSIDSNGYWLKFKDVCMDETIEISCDQDFVTALAYQKKSGGKFYIFGEAHSAASLGTTTERVNSECFMVNDNCNYEGSLWSALAYREMGADINKYLPYLLAYSEENARFFPESFLYILTGGTEFYSNVVQNQKQSKYWQVSGTPYNRFYDTSLAMIALGPTSAVELSNARDYLADIQTKEGCWNNNNLRDTAFVLYAGWPRNVQSAQQSCVGAGYSCQSSSTCESAGGEVLYDYECPTFAAPCCSVNVPQKSCSEQNGVVCSSDEECASTEVSSSDGSCCLGECIPSVEENICEASGGTCKSECSRGEIEDIYSCGNDPGVCCVEDEESSSGIIWWIIILVLLIGAVVAGIIYREKLKYLLNKVKDRFGKKGGQEGNAPQGPGSPPRVAPGRPPSQGVGRTQPQSMTQIKPRMAIKPELDNTLQKLREMHG